MKFRAQLLRLGAPADICGDIFEPGCLKPATVPVTRDFDVNALIGTARIHADGSADVELLPGVELATGNIEQDVGIGFVTERWAEEPNGDRRVEAIRPICLGIDTKEKSK